MKMLDVAPTDTPVIGTLSREPCGHHSACGCSRTWLDVSLRNAIPWKDRGRLKETTIKDILGGIDETFLDQGRRALELRVVNLNNLSPWDPDEAPGTMWFDAASSVFEDNNWTIYKCLVQFVEWEQMVNDLTLKPNEAARLLFWAGNVRLSCSDPSFLYYGYQYILTQLDASIYPEERPPHINNPGMAGTVCKHLNRVMKILPFHLGDIAQEIKRQRAERGL